MARRDFAIKTLGEACDAPLWLRQAYGAADQPGLVPESEYPKIDADIQRICPAWGALSREDGGAKFRGCELATLGLVDEGEVATWPNIPIRVFSLYADWTELGASPMLLRPFFRALILSSVVPGSIYDEGPPWIPLRRDQLEPPSDFEMFRLTNKGVSRGSRRWEQGEEGVAKEVRYILSRTGGRGGLILVPDNGVPQAAIDELAEHAWAAGADVVEVLAEEEDGEGVGVYRLSRGRSHVGGGVGSTGPRDDRSGSP
jgi:hypothetical protein